MLSLDDRILIQTTNVPQTAFCQLQLRKQVQYFNNDKISITNLIGIYLKD